jgi:hypothetical protein
MKFCLQLNPQVSIGTATMLPRFDWTPGLPRQDILDSMRLFGERVIQKL